jgi:hypothetical protein
MAFRVKQLISIAILSLICAELAIADVKLVLRTRSRFGSPGQFLETELVGYLKGERKRVERVSTLTDENGKEIARKLKGTYIYQCDVGLTIDLDVGRRQFATFEIPRGQKVVGFSAEVPDRRRRVRIERHTVDTGERRMAFGRIARHLITTVKRTPENAGDPAAQETIDGWYVDFDASGECGPTEVFLRPTALAGSTNSLEEAYEIVESGTRLSGLPIRVRVETKEFIARPHPTAHGAMVFSAEQVMTVSELEVIEISEEPLSASLFEPPPSFKKVSKLKGTP